MRKIRSVIHWRLLRALGVFVALVYLVIGDWVALSRAETRDAGLTLRQTGPAQTVFSWKTMRCETWDVPDVPARAWRDARGKIHLLASNTSNREMVGPDLDHVRQDCRVVFKANEADDPSRWDDRGWISGVWTTDGSDVYALIHNEFHGHLRPALCPSRVYERCWWNTVTEVVSHDGGISFARPTPPWQYVAGLPYRYKGDLGHRVGYFQPSNIIKKDGEWYAFIWAEAERAQHRGVCLMRSLDVSDRRAWRAWDGHDFTVRFLDPYIDEVKAPERHVCAPIAEGVLTSFVSSVTLHRPSGLYVALMATVRSPRPGAAPVSGIFAATSPDLLHWSAPSLVRETPLLFKFGCGDSHAAAYPALLDPLSTSRNFEDMGDRAYLYLSDLHPSDCKLGPDRDLVRIPVAVGSAAG
jgi:hypothetical protein